MPKNQARVPAASAAHSQIDPMTTAMLAIVHETMPHPPKRPYSSESYLPAHLLELGIAALRGVGIDVEPTVVGGSDRPSSPAGASDGEGPTAMRRSRPMLRSSDRDHTLEFSEPPVLLNPQASVADLVALALARATQAAQLADLIACGEQDEGQIAELLRGPFEDVVTVLEELSGRGAK